MENRNILKNTNKYIATLLIVVLAVSTRLIPHPPNFAPIAGISLFSGAKLNKKQAFLIPLSAMFISDIFLGFHSTMLYVYLSFVLIVFIGIFIKKRLNFHNLVLASLTSSVLFYFITNFGVWASTALYPKTLSGLLQSYVLAIPFFNNTIASDLLYTGSLFYGYQLIEYLVKRFTFIRNSVK